MRNALHRRALAGALSLLGGLGSGAARAEPPATPAAPDVWSKKLGLELHLTQDDGILFEGPYGGLGVALDLTPLPLLSIAAGVGVSGAGARFAVLERFRPVRGDRVAWTIGVGPSTGAYSDATVNDPFGGSGGTNHLFARPLWLNVETGAEIHFGARVSMRFSIGVGRIVNPSSNTCEGGGAACGPPTGLDTTVVYLDEVLGFSLF